MVTLTIKDALPASSGFGCLSCARLAVTHKRSTPTETATGRPGSSMTPARICDLGSFMDGDLRWS